MTDAEIIKALEFCSSDEVGLCHICPLDGECNGDINILLKYALDLINRLQTDQEALIAGQETLQKALAEKAAEVERLKNDCFCISNERDAIGDCLNEAVEEAKAEAIKECVEKTQAFLAIKCRGVVEDNPNLDEILWGYRKEDVDEFFDNLVKEMAGDTE